MSPRRSNYPPTSGKPLDDVLPLKKRILRKPISCEGYPPCGCADCSGCTTALLERLAPQIEEQLLTGTWWLPFTLIWSVQFFSNTELNGISFAQCSRALRDKFRKHGLNGIPIIGALDINREEYLSDEGILDGYLWSIHLHGFMRVDANRSEIEALFKTAFPPSLKVKRPFLFHKAGSQRGWAEYTFKDPSRFGKRVHDPRVDWPYKRQLSNREAQPAMDFLAKHQVRDRLFLQGFQLQGRDQLVPINDFGRWLGGKGKSRGLPVPPEVTRVRTRISSNEPKKG